MSAPGEIFPTELDSRRARRQYENQNKSENKVPAPKPSMKPEAGVLTAKATKTMGSENVGGDALNSSSLRIPSIPCLPKETVTQEKDEESHRENMSLNVNLPPLSTQALHPEAQKFADMAELLSAQYGFNMAKDARSHGYHLPLGLHAYGEHPLFMGAGGLEQSMERRFGSMPPGANFFSPTLNPALGGKLNVDVSLL